jgi:hypothetical protein
MENLGNVSGRVLDSMPPQWDDVHVCLGCKIKRTVRIREVATSPNIDLSEFEEIKP